MKTPIGWTCDEDGPLHDSLEEAVWSWLEDADPDCPGTVEVYGYAPMVPQFGGHAPRWFVDVALEHLGEEFGDGDDPVPSAEAMTAMERAAKRFLGVVEQHYSTRMCERVQTQVVNVEDYR